MGKLTYMEHVLEWPGPLVLNKILPGAEQAMPWMSHILRAGEILRGIVESSLSFPIATVSFP